MDKLSDFIPLLIIVGSIVISIAQSSNKKKAKQDMQKTMLPKGIPVEKSKEIPSVNLPKMKSMSSEMEKEEKKTKIRPVQEVFNPEVERVLTTVPESRALESEVPESPGFMFDTTDTDELKKAVIYSEIINRKEY
ncbi:MAG: hypothetical protein LBU57_04350 [Dysgonamonadaceae bacterium]|jgi:hypothetical protein|nr:hypothetical protein [Dysgonamonadaceae bacterium]